MTNALLTKLLALKPGELAAGLVSLIEQLEPLVERLAGDAGEADRAREMLVTLRAYAEAVRRVTGGYDLGELASADPLVAGGSGREQLEAGLLAEARGEAVDASLAPTPAPSGTKGPNKPPP